MRKLENKGFTLVEVLLSITIIAILFVSTLHIFTNAAKVNQVAKKQQNATDCAQNIMESLQSLTLEETAIQYTKSGYPEGTVTASHNFIQYTTPSVTSATKNGALTYTFSPPSGREEFSFKISNVEEGGSTYDALVTLDTTAYNDSTNYPNSMNNYKAPELLTINDSIVAIIDLENLKATSAYDTEAISEFQTFHTSYIVAVEAKPTPIPTHTHITDDEIKASITKNIIMQLNKNAINNEVDISCYLEYTCRDLNDNGTAEKFISDEIYSGSFMIPASTEDVSNIYLFYTPSSFAVTNAVTRQDTITIMNNDAVKANVYIAYQESSPAVVPVTIKKLTNTGLDTSNTITIFADFIGTINSTSFSAGKLYDQTISDYRIYQITVEIFPVGTINYNKPYVTLTSVKEN